MSRMFALVLCLYLSTVSPFVDCKKYRTDYEYNDATDAFYKLHTDGVHSMRAQKICELEGAGLVDISSDRDVEQVHRMIKLFPDLGNLVWVKNDGEPHESAEEPSIINIEEFEEPGPIPRPWDQCEVINRDGKIEITRCFDSLPFVCKVNARDAPYDRTCDIYGTDYQRAENLNSCYKIPPFAISWNHAYAECMAQGAHLVVLNSQAEHDYVWDLMKKTPAVAGSQASFFFFAGFRAEPRTDGSPRVFKTIFNQTLEEAGFSTWAEGEPNNAKNDEDCGTLFKNDGNFNDVYCNHLYGFICEKEIAVAPAVAS